VIAEDGGAARIRHEVIEHLPIPLALHDEVADGDDAVVCARLNFVEQGHEFVVAAVYVSDNDGACGHSIIMPVSTRMNLTVRV
jgi:hypothetical protein